MTASKTVSRTSFAMAALTLAALSGAAGLAEEKQPSPQSVASLLQQIGSPSFIQRDWAGRQLIEAGPDVVPRLVAAVEADPAGSASASIVTLLRDMALHHDDLLASAALRGLSSLSDEAEQLTEELRSLVDAADREGLQSHAARLIALGAEIERDEQQRITELSVDSEQFSDRHMALVGALTTLTDLDLRGTSVTSDALTFLAPLTRLERLILADTAITGKGLRQLPFLPALRRLSLFRITISEEDRRWLQEHLPNCEIFP